MEEKSAEAELEADLICTLAATRASRKTVSANFVGEGTGKDAGWGAKPSGRFPESVTTAEPSGFVTTLGGSKEGLESAGVVVT